MGNRQSSGSMDAKRTAQIKVNHCRLLETLSSIAVPGDALLGAQRCADDYLSKPFRAKDLRSKLIPVFNLAAENGPVVQGARQEDSLTLSIEEDMRAAGIESSVTNTLRQLMEAKDFRFLVESYVSRAAAYLAEAHQHLDELNTEKLHFVLHTLKGSSGNIGALGLAKVCADLDDRVIKAAMGEDFALQLKILDDMFVKVRTCLQRTLDTGGQHIA